MVVFYARFGIKHLKETTKMLVHSSWKYPSKLLRNIALRIIQKKLPVKSVTEPTPSSAPCEQECKTNQQTNKVNKVDERCLLRDA